jgi:N-acetylglutamate synthase-like GNAT family acetyltransferase
MEIKEITDDGRLDEAVRMIRESFATVAGDMGLNRENCPSHPSFTVPDELVEMKKKGVGLFGMYLEDRLSGFVALEKAGRELCYLEKLAVLPEERHKGYGENLVGFACLRAVALGASRISAGIINEQEILKSWYERLGFAEKETRSYPHLPFTVCFMEKELP